MCVCCFLFFVPGGTPGHTSTGPIYCFAVIVPVSDMKGDGSRYVHCGSTGQLVCNSEVAAIVWYQLIAIWFAEPFSPCPQIASALLRSVHSAGGSMLRI